MAGYPNTEADHIGPAATLASDSNSKPSQAASCHTVPGNPDSDDEDTVFARLISPVTPEEFFAKTWQRSPRLFLAKDAPNGEETRPIERQSWSDGCDLLLLKTLLDQSGFDLLYFKDKAMTRDYERFGPYAAILDGASCVVNHAEYAHPALSELCVQLRRRLLHVYANSYITPAKAQATRAHADDRDVFILQLRGTKHWRVYEEPPIALPYSDEQVGKNGLEIPERIFDRLVIEHEMLPGDVLYMPRGYVHEAFCSDHASWHVTLAVATHDWSWSKALLDMGRRELEAEGQNARWRLAVPLSLGLADAEARSEDVKAAEAEILDARPVLEQIFSESKVSKLRETMQNKIRGHNESQVHSIELGQEYLRDPRKQAALYKRLKPICAETRIRRATREEMEAGKGKGVGKGGERGLIVRDEVAPAVNAAVRHLTAQGEKGLLVSELNGTCDDKDAMALFDDFTRVCLARVLINMNAAKTVQSLSM